MNGHAKVIMAIGGIIFIIGFLLQFLKLGRLPGDLMMKKGSMTVYFPFMTSILISIILSVIMYIASRFK